MPNRKIYLASGWFTDEQMKTMKAVREAIREVSEFDLFAPYYDGVAITKETDTQELRQQVYNLDICTIAECDLVVAVIDDFDPGTIFEMGFAGALNFLRDRILLSNEQIHSLLGIKIPHIIAYSDVPRRGLNIMLAQSCIGFANGIPDLKKKLLSLDDLIKNKEIWRGEYI